MHFGTQRAYGRRAGTMSTTGPWAFTLFTAPQSAQVGVTSVCPTWTKVGTQTRPPHSEQVPITAGGELDTIRTSPVDVMCMRNGTKVLAPGEYGGG